jgi:hypothetical protein
MKFVMHRDRHRDVRRAAGTVVSDGYFQWREGRVWVSRPFKESEKSSLVAALSRHSRVMDKRTDWPTEVFRTQFYRAERLRKADAEFRAECDSLFAELSEN